MPITPRVLVPPRPPASALRVAASAVMPPDIAQLIDVLARIERRRQAQRLTPVSVGSTRLKGAQ